MENQSQKPDKTNEIGGIRLQGHIKIFDPHTKEVLVQKRGDV